MANTGRKLVHTVAVDSVKRFADIPGPTRVPLWGSLLHYKLGRFNYVEYPKVLKQLYKEYGPVVREDLGPNRTVIHVFEPEDARTVYQAEGKTPAVMPLQDTTQMYRKKRNLSPGLGNTNGEEWYRLRTAVRKMMLRPKEVHHYLPVVNEIAQQFVEKLHTIKGSDGMIPNLRNETGKWNREVSAMICFEKRLGAMSGGESEQEIERLIISNKKMFELSTELKYSLPLYMYMGTPKWKNLLKYEDHFNLSAIRLIKETIDNIKALIKENKLQEGQYSFLMYLLARPELSEKDVEILALSLFADGLTTTVPTLVNNLYCLAANPELQEAVLEEVTKASPDGYYDVVALNKIPLLKSVVKETFRFYPIGTEISRIIDKDLVLSGYHVPKDTHVNLNQTVHYQSEKYFNDPDQYKPERWLREGVETDDIHPYLLVPFGHGTRTCIGRRFAELDLYVALSKILRNFRLEYPKNAPKLEQLYHILMLPKEPIKVQFIPRK